MWDPGDYSAVTGTVNRTTEIKGIPQPSASFKKGRKSNKLSMYDKIKHLFQNMLKLAMLNSNLLMKHPVSHKFTLKTDFFKWTMGPFGLLNKKLDTHHVLKNIFFSSIKPKTSKNIKVQLSTSETKILL